jgi:hypothetical protein
LKARRYCLKAQKTPLESWVVLVPAAEISILPLLTLDSLSKPNASDSVKARRDWPVLLLLLGLYFAIHLPYFHKLGRFITDSGKEVMVPYLLLNGDMLYGDIFWLYGPWAPYFNSWMYSLFGVHTDVLMGVAKLLGAGVVLGVYVCLRNLVPKRTAFIGAVSVLAFSTTSGYFAWPYSFSNLWATCMALYAVCTISLWQTTRCMRHLILSAVCTIIVVSCKFIIALPILVALWAAILIRRSSDRSLTFEQKKTAVSSAFGYTLGVTLVFVLVTWFFSQFTGLESYQLQAGTGFHARHLAAAGLYERLLETVFLQNGTSPENLSAALGILISPISVLFGLASWIFFWRREADLRPRLIALVPFYAFALGNLLQVNSSVHSPYVYPASAITLFSALELWRFRPESIRSSKIVTCLITGVMLCCVVLAAGRLCKLSSSQPPLDSAQFTFQWPSSQDLILQNLASDIREQTRVEDRIIIFNSFDYLYLLFERKPALGYFYTWYEPFHDKTAALKVEEALQSEDVTLCLTHLTEPFSLAFAPDYRSHPIYQTLQKNFEPEINPDRWGEFVVWKKRPNSKKLSGETAVTPPMR